MCKMCKNPNGISLAKVAKTRQEDSHAYNHEETPLFAKSIKNKALFGKYNPPFKKIKL